VAYAKKLLQGVPGKVRVEGDSGQGLPTNGAAVRSSPTNGKASGQSRRPRAQLEWPRQQHARLLAWNRCLATTEQRQACHSSWVRHKRLNGAIGSDGCYDAIAGQNIMRA